MSFTPCSAAILIAVFTMQTGLAEPKKKKKEEKEITQVLELPKDPPAAVVADSTRLGFLVSPLSGKGLLSQQVRDGLKTLFGAAKGGTIVRLRAFVSGSGDMRRVQAIVSEVFSDKRQPIPALSTIQAGALPLEGAQVVLEATLQEKRPGTPNGVAFISGQPAKAGDVTTALKTALGSVSLDAGSVRKLTCYLESLEHLSSVRGQISAAFPKSATNYVQLRRDSVGDFVECEAVAALTKRPDKQVSYAGAMENRYSQVAVVGPAKLAITGLQLAFGREENDLRRALERLGKALEGVRADFKRVVMSNMYPLSSSVAEKIRKIRFEHYNPKTPPASTLLLFEGLPSLDGTLGIDVIAISE